MPEFNRDNSATIQALVERNERLRAENERLRKALEAAATEIEDWGQYAADYFRNKYQLDESVSYYRNLAKENQK